MKATRLAAHQREHVSDIQASLRTVRRLLFVLPTGTGKTVLAASLVAQWAFSGKRVVIFVHRAELVNQWVRWLRAFGLSEEQVGVMRAKDSRTNPDAIVQVCSVMTLIRRVAPKADYVVIDEAHRIAADSYGSGLSWYRDAKWLGLTATPVRFDGKPLRPFFDEMLVGKPPSWLIEHKHLAPRARIFAPVGAGDRLKGVRKRASGDYDPAAVAKLLNSAGALYGDPVAEWLKHAKGRRTVAYAGSVKQAHALAVRFAEAGANVATVTDETPEGARRKVLGDGDRDEGQLGRGEISVVVNCQVLIEGYDCPAVKCIVLVRPVHSVTAYLQMCGRGQRRWLIDRGRFKGLPMAPIILDHAGNVFRRGLGDPCADREWSLDGIGRNGNGIAAPIKQCEECGFFSPAGAGECEECGAEFPRKEPEIAEVDGVLDEIAPLTPEAREEAIAKVLAMFNRPMPRAFAERAVDAGVRP